MAQHHRIQHVYSSRSDEELEERYDQWAADYDHDLMVDLGWSGPDAAVEVLARFVAPDAKVLDAGAGTGLVGAALAGHGSPMPLASISHMGCWRWHAGQALTKRSDERSWASR